jgi:hypothetical protein
MKTLTRIALIASLAATCGAAQAQDNLLTNGSFEDIGKAKPQISWGGFTYGQDYSKMVGWKVTGSVDIVPTGRSWGDAAQGTYFLDLNGYGKGSISQSFKTTKGQLYDLSFYVWRNPGGADPATGFFDITSGDKNLLKDTFISVSKAQQGWVKYDVTFTGNGKNDTLTFQSTVRGNSGGLTLDNVSIAAVPEPGEWALMLAGLGMMGFIVRRRQSLNG